MAVFSCKIYNTNKLIKESELYIFLIRHFSALYIKSYMKATVKFKLNPNSMSIQPHIKAL